jgi:hypothetical protein
LIEKTENASKPGGNMFKRIVMLAVALGLAAMVGNVRLAAAEDMPAKDTIKVVCSNNMQFAEFLAQKYGISIPDTTPPMSNEDKYKALANSLSEKGITFFLTAKASDPVTYDGVAEALLQITGAGAGKDISTCSLKVGLLADAGLLKLGEGTTSADACGKPCPNVEEIFNNPLVVEKYAPPAGENPVGRPLGQPQIEQQSSRI